MGGVVVVVAVVFGGQQLLRGQFLTCGDGNLDPGEQCDSSPGCSASCTPVVCGNGLCELDMTNTQEDCPDDCHCGMNGCESDKGENAATCDIDCPAICPDGFCTAWEMCDNCPQDCGECSSLPSECPGGPPCSEDEPQNDPMINDYEAPECGNGKVEEGEYCDDGNKTDGDGCNDSQNNGCQSECGDGRKDADGADNIPDTADDEECDKGNPSDMTHGEQGKNIPIAIASMDYILLMQPEQEADRKMLESAGKESCTTSCTIPRCSNEKADDGANGEPVLRDGKEVSDADALTCRSLIKDKQKYMPGYDAPGTCPCKLIDSAEQPHEQEDQVAPAFGAIISEAPARKYFSLRWLLGELDARKEDPQKGTEGMFPCEEIDPSDKKIRVCKSKECTWKDRPNPIAKGTNGCPTDFRCMDYGAYGMGVPLEDRTYACKRLSEDGESCSYGSDCLENYRADGTAEWLYPSWASMKDTLGRICYLGYGNDRFGECCGGAGGKDCMGNINERYQFQWIDLPICGGYGGQQKKDEKGGTNTSQKKNDSNSSEGEDVGGGDGGGGGANTGGTTGGTTGGQQGTSSSKVTTTTSSSQKLSTTSSSQPRSSSSSSSSPPSSSSSSSVTSSSLPISSSTSTSAPIVFVASSSPQPPLTCSNGGDALCLRQGMLCKSLDWPPFMECVLPPASRPLQLSLVASVTAVCGNMTLEEGEECDDGNARDFDGCSFDCLRETGMCGNGIVESLLGEQCEEAVHDPLLPYGCGPDCRFLLLYCNDGKQDPGEDCDLGINNSDAPGAYCRKNCSLARCGDLILDTLQGEQCDDGNGVGGDGCNRQCLLERPAPPEDIVRVFDLPVTSPPLLTAMLPPHPPVGSTGPAAVAVMACGAAAGMAWMRRRRK